MTPTTQRLLTAIALAIATPAIAQSPAATTWTEDTLGQGPPDRTWHSMSYDTVNERVLLFGGQELPSGVFSSALWAWDDDNWNILSTGSPVPTGRALHAAAYNERGGYLILFGGTPNGATLLSDTWLFTGSSWVQQTPATSPTQRFGHAMVYDAARRVVILFGGHNGFAPSNDTWQWDGLTWTQLSPANAPPARHRAAMAYDPRRQQIVLFGGRDSFGRPLDDTWTFDGTDWTQETPTERPYARYGARMDHVESLGGPVLVGEHLGTAGDTWLWNGFNWVEITGIAPPGSQYHDLAYHRADDTLVFHGGQIGSVAQTWTMTTSAHPVMHVDHAATGNGSGTSWRHAATNLRAVLNVAQPAQEVRVAQGTYRPDTSDRNASFDVPSGAIVKGSYAGSTAPNPDARSDFSPSVFPTLSTPTILDGDLNGDDLAGDLAANRTDNSYHVVDLAATETTTLFDGFVIQNGEADGTGPSGSNAGGGIAMSRNGYATIRSCTVRQCRSDFYGGGIWSVDGSPTLIACDVIDNHTDSSGGGGMRSSGDGSPALYCCRFLGNSTSGSGGAISNNSSSMLVVNGVFAGNTANASGGAVYTFGAGADLTVHSTTVYGNDANVCGGIHAAFFARLNLYGSVLWDNTDGTGNFTQLQQRSVSLSGILGVERDTSVEGIEAATPVFTDEDGSDNVLGTTDDDFTPDPSSSSLTDRADYLDLPPDLADLDGDGNTGEGIPVDAQGRPRAIDIGLMGGTHAMDRGAYELCPPLPVSITAPSDQTATEGDVVVFHASVSTTNCGFFYSWSRDGLPIAFDDRVTSTNGTLRFDPVQPDDEGEYVAAISFFCGNSPCGYDQPIPSQFNVTLTVDFAADHDGDGDVEVTDLLAFLSDWFSGNDIADFNEDGTTDVTDLLAFLSYWFQYN